MNETDSRVASGLRQRDESALEAAYADHAKPCFALARRLLIDVGLAEDVLQDVFSALWMKPESFDPARGSLRTWLLTLTHHKSVDRIRSRERHGTDHVPDAILETIPSPGGSPEAEAVGADRARHVANALKGLPDTQREVLTLAYFGGYTQSEIARLISVPLGTVKSRTLNAMKRLSIELTALHPTAQW